MIGHKVIYPTAFACILAGILSGCADFPQGGVKDSSADATITMDVKTRLDQMSYLGPPGSIRVQTLDHVVYLNGLVDAGLEKSSAESVAAQVPGVTRVADNIAVLRN